jgi:hypothetical protein
MNNKAINTVILTEEQQQLLAPIEGKENIAIEEALRLLSPPGQLLLSRL